MLESCGYNVLVAQTPEDALRIARSREEKIDLLLTDVVMPSMNGEEVQSAVAEARPGLRSLFMSRYAADTISPYGVLEEGVHFIHNPFTVSSLAETVRRVLDTPNGTA